MHMGPWFGLEGEVSPWYSLGLSEDGHHTAKVKGRGTYPQKGRFWQTGSMREVKIALVCARIL